MHWSAGGGPTELFRHPLIDGGTLTALAASARGVAYQEGLECTTHVLDVDTRRDLWLQDAACDRPSVTNDGEVLLFRWWTPASDQRVGAGALGAIRLGETRARELDTPNAVGDVVFSDDGSAFAIASHNLVGPSGAVDVYSVGALSRRRHVIVSDGLPDLVDHSPSHLLAARWDGSDVRYSLIAWGAP